MIRWKDKEDKNWLIYKNRETGEHIERELTEEKAAEFDEALHPGVKARTLVEIEENEEEGIEENNEPLKVERLSGIIHEGMRASTHQCLEEQLRKPFDVWPRLEENFTEGKHFNIQNLLAAFRIHDEKWPQWTWRQRSLFWRRIIGHIEDYLPDNVAQAFCMGLKNAITAERLGRSLNLDDGSPFFSHSPLLSLAYHFAVYSYYAGVVVRGEWGGAGSASGGPALEQLCQERDSSVLQHSEFLDHLIAELRPPTPH